MDESLSIPSFRIIGVCREFPFKGMGNHVQLIHDMHFQAFDGASDFVFSFPFFAYFSDLPH